MSSKQYKITNDERLGKYIQDFSVDNVILEDYFYSKPDLLSGSNSQYSDEDLGLILNLTDTEYANLVKRYTTTDDKSSELDDSIRKSQDRINELETLIEKNKNLEDSQKNIEEKKKELESITKQLSLFEDINAKLIDAKNEFSKYEVLSKYNLQKIHEDLSKINHDINEIEEQLLNQKVGEIRQKKTYASYDNGKVVLALGVGIACAILGGVFLFFDMPTFITFTIWGIGFIISAILIFSSRNTNVEIVSEYTDEYYSDEDLKNGLDQLKAKRRAILNILNLKHPDEFFLVKARFASAKKALDSMMQKYQEITQDNQINELLNKKAELIKQIDISRESDASAKLPQEKVLEIYRELDILKLKVGGASKNINIDRESIPGKIAEIKNELKAKLPNYINLLQTTFSNAVDEIKSNFEVLAVKIGLKSDKDIQKYSELENDEKILVQYALAKKFYKQNFYFIIPDSSKFDEKSKDTINKLVSSDISGNFVKIDE